MFCGLRISSDGASVMTEKKGDKITLSREHLSALVSIINSYCAAHRVTFATSHDVKLSTERNKFSRTVTNIFQS